MWQKGGGEVSAKQGAGVGGRGIRWSELGAPTEPGTYRVPGVGDVEVAQADIARAAELGGDPRVEVVMARSLQDPAKVFALGRFTPEEEGGVR